MRKGFMFNSARTMALASLLTVIGLPVIGPGAVVAAPLERNAGPIAPGQPGPDDPLDLMFDFWLETWGLDFIPGQSSMFLAEDLGADVWLVQVADAGLEDPIVAQGALVEAAREHLAYLAWDQQRLDQSGLLAAAHFFIAGTIFGTTGFQSPGVFMVLEIVHPGENPGDDTILTRILTPVRLNTNIDAAVLDMSQLAHLIEADTDDMIITENVGLDHPPFTVLDEVTDDDDTTPNTCETVHQLCIDSCVFNFLAREVVCTGAAVACLAVCAIGCAASTIAYPLCLAICAGGCLLAELACLGASHLLLEACLVDCLIDRLMCESQ